MSVPLAHQRICLHATPIAEGVNRCDLNLFGGRPSVGTCVICKDRKPSEGDGLLSADSEARLATHKSVCLGCDQRIGFDRLPGTLIDVCVLCEACSCPRKRVNLLTGNCPQRKWTNA